MQEKHMSKLIKIESRNFGMKSAKYKIEGKEIYVFKCFSEESGKDMWRIQDEKLNERYEENMDTDYPYFSDAKKDALKRYL
jgi:hypothetical protein